MTGSFTVDVNTQTVSSWSVAVAGGSTAGLGARTYTPANSSFTFFPTQGTYMFSDTSTAPSRDLRFGPFDNPLTNAGGTVNTVPSAFGNTECLNCSPFRTLTATLTSTPADLTVTKSHPGIFVRGQTNATYTITVNNIQPGGPSIGTVFVTDTLPAGMTATAINGPGWACILGTLTCNRADTLDGGASYPPITLTLNVGPGTASSVINTVAVSGGQESNTGNDTTNDPTTVNDPPDLVISKTHTGNFTQGQASASYTITVTNTGLGPTLAAVSVVDTLPTGLTRISMTGTGWACVNLTCTRADALAPSASYPAITLVVSVAANAPPSVVNSVTVSGGFELNATNDTATDPTTVIQVADLTVSKSHARAFHARANWVLYDDGAKRGTWTYRRCSNHHRLAPIRSDRHGNDWRWVELQPRDAHLHALRRAGHQFRLSTDYAQREHSAKLSSGRDEFSFCLRWSANQFRERYGERSDARESGHHHWVDCSSRGYGWRSIFPGRSAPRVAFLLTRGLPPDCRPG